MTTTSGTRTSDAADTPVTVIGLGLMGQALAAALLEDGHPTTVWNRSPRKADHLVDRGATRAAAVEEAVTASPLVVVCVSDYDAVHELLDPLQGVLADRVLVNLTSGTSQQARETAGWASQRDCLYLDGAIMTVPPEVGTAEALLFYSGPRSAFDRHESTLRSLGGSTTYLGVDHGLSSLYDVALLGIMWSILNGFLQGAALVGTANVDAATFAQVASKGIVTVAQWASAYADQIDVGDYPAFDSTIDTHLAAMKHLIDESESLGINAELPRFIKVLTDRAVAQGRGGASYAAMIDQFRKPPGERP